MQMLLPVLLMMLLASLVSAAENVTETAADEAEFRQGGIGQQLVSGGGGYPGLYGGGQLSGASNGGGYVNMLRNLYRPPSLGLTDKVKHWVKSFMNRRQYVKPYYVPSSGLQYSPDEFGTGGGKPVFVGGNGYKAISVPLRQLQKYYKPYYADSAPNFGLQQQQQGNAAAAASSLLSYSPGGLYDAGQFSSGSSAGLFSSSSGGNYFSPSSEGMFSQGGYDGSSALFGGYGGSALYQPSSSASNGFSQDGGYGGSDSSSYFGASAQSGSGTSARGVQSLSGGDLYASGASPAVSALYNPNQDNKKQQQMYGMRNADSNVDSTRNGNNSPGVESPYSVAFQPSAQANSGFQPVSFQASDFQGKSS